MKLSETLSKRPDSSEIYVCRKFVQRLISLQKQLDQCYHEDRFLRQWVEVLLTVMTQFLPCVNNKLNTVQVYSKNFI